jgi:hypothetical protein
MLEHANGSASFFQAMAPVLIANVFVYSFVKIHQKELTGEEGRLTYLWLITIETPVYSAAQRQSTCSILGGIPPGKNNTGLPRPSAPIDLPAPFHGVLNGVLLTHCWRRQRASGRSVCRSPTQGPSRAHCRRLNQPIVPEG